MIPALGITTISPPPPFNHTPYHSITLGCLHPNDIQSSPVVASRKRPYEAVSGRIRSYRVVSVRNSPYDLVLDRSGSLFCSPHLLKCHPLQTYRRFILPTVHLTFQFRPFGPGFGPDHLVAISVGKHHRACVSPIYPFQPNDPSSNLLSHSTSEEHLIILILIIVIIIFIISR